MLLLGALIVFGLTLSDQGIVGRVLRAWLVDRPARFLARMAPGQATGVGLIALLGVAAVVIFEAEGVRLFSMAAPDLIAWVWMFDVTVVFDLVVLAISLRAGASWRGLVRWRTLAVTAVKMRVARFTVGIRPRGKRASKPRPPESPSSDPEHGPAYAFA